MPISVPAGIRRYDDTVVPLGGINTGLIDELIDDTELADVENYIPDNAQAGVIVKREGLTREVAETDAVTSIFQGRNANYYTAGTKIKNFAGTVLHTLASAPADPSWTRFGFLDIVADGNVVLKSADGTSFTSLGGTPPSFKYVEAFNNMLFGAGHSDFSLRISELGNAESWPASNEITLDNKITGLRAWRDVLLVFCEGAIYFVSGFAPGELQVTMASREAGTTSHRSIVRTPFGVFFWSDFGLGLLNSSGEIRFPSLKSLGGIQIDRLLQIYDGLNKAKYSLVHAVWSSVKRRLQIYVHDGTSATVNKAIYYYPTEDSFWIQTGKGVEMGASGTAVISGKENVYVGSAAASGALYRVEGKDDDGMAIRAFLHTKRGTAKLGATVVKRARELNPMFILTDGDINLTYEVLINNETVPVSERAWQLLVSPGGVFILDSSSLDSGVLGGALAAEDFRIGVSFRWKKLQHRISDSAPVRTRVRFFENKGFLVNA